jgi:hypothetical protein
MPARLPRLAMQRRSMASDESTSVEILLALVKRDPSDRRVLQAVATNKSMPWLALAALNRDLDPDLRPIVGRAVDPSKAIQVVMDKNPVARASMVSRPFPWSGRADDALRALLLLLAGSSAHHVRERVAAHDSSPTEVLCLLADDRCVDVLIRLAQNRLTPPTALSRLAHLRLSDLVEGTTGGHTAPARPQSLQTLRRQVASNVSTPVGVLRTLAADGFRSVVADNPSAPSSLLATIARAALDSPRANMSDVDDSMRGLESKAVLQAVSRNRSTPSETLVELVSAGFFDEVANNSSSPSDLLDEIARKHWTAVPAVARNPNTAKHTLERIASDPTSSAWEVAQLRLRSQQWETT